MRSAERPGNLAIFGVTLAAKCLLHPQRGGCNMVFGLGLPQPHSSICLIPLWLAALKRPSCVPGPHVGLGRERPPPQNRGVMRSRTDGRCNMPLYRPPWVAHVLIYPCGKARNSPPTSWVFQGVDAALDSSLFWRRLQRPGTRTGLGP